MYNSIWILLHEQLCSAPIPRQVMTLKSIMVLRPKQRNLLLRASQRNLTTPSADTEFLSPSIQMLSPRLFLPAFITVLLKWNFLEQFRFWFRLSNYFSRLFWDVYMCSNINEYNCHLYIAIFSVWLSSKFCIYHHHHHVVPPARISLTLSRHFFLSFIASGRSSELHPVSSNSCCMYVRAGRPAFARP